MLDCVPVAMCIVGVVAFCRGVHLYGQTSKKVGCGHALAGMLMLAFGLGGVLF
jgi:hypothetical protein